MITYELRFKRKSEITILPDSHRLFGFLMYYSKKWIDEKEVGQYVEGVLCNRESCFVSNLLPSGYLPMPKDYVLSLIGKKMHINLTLVKNKEQKMHDKKQELRAEIEILNANRNKMKKNEIKRIHEKMSEMKADYHQLSECCYRHSSKNIYEAIKSIDFIREDDLETLIKDIRSNKIITTELIPADRALKMTHGFVQRFRLDSQVYQLPGKPNAAYSLSVLSIGEKNSQCDYSFFVRVVPDSTLDRSIRNMRNELDNSTVPCYLGPKASAGYNQYEMIAIDEYGESVESKTGRFLNMGMLLPNFDLIDTEQSTMSLYTSNRKPLEIDDEVSKVISFVAPGSIIQAKDGNADFRSRMGKCVQNRYNPLYKNSIVFGNSYFKSLEV